MESSHDEAKSHFLKEGEFGNSAGAVGEGMTSEKIDVDGDGNVVPDSATGGLQAQSDQLNFSKQREEEDMEMDGAGAGEEKETRTLPFPSLSASTLMAELQQTVKDQDDKIKRLKRRLHHFRAKYPKFEPMRREWKGLLKEEKSLTVNVENLNASIDEANEEIQRKLEEIEGLQKAVGKLEEKNRTARPGTDEDQMMNDNGKDAILILPEEVWGMIFTHLPNPKDVWNCSNSCGLFKEILGDWKKPTWDFIQAFPLLFQYLPQNEILKCRSVSKGWSMAVDQHMEHHPLLRPLDKDDYDPRMLPFVTPMKEKRFYRLNKFDFRRQRPKFPNALGRNPFLGKAVTLIIGLSGILLDSDEVYGIAGGWLAYQEEEQRKINLFWKRIYSFLETFGKDIWFLTLNSQGGNLGYGNDYEFKYDLKYRHLITVDLASLTPNLRKLRILPSDREAHSYPSDLTIASLPAFPALETLVASSQHVNRMNYPVLLMLQRHHLTLREVHLTGDLWTQTRIFLELDWPQLRELHLDHLTNYLDFDFLLDSYPGARAPLLRKLGVNLRDRRGSFDWLLDLLHRFLATSPLSTLRLLGGIRPRMFQRIRWKSCMSPTLKTLEVEHGDRDGFYNFLLRFPLVENVHVFVRRGQRMEAVYYDEEEEDGQELDVHKYICNGKMYHSNIWEALPRLQLFTFRWDEYTRAGYEQFMEGQRRS